MKREEWRKLIYDNYVTNQLGGSHIGDKKLKAYFRYFKKNYLPYMPSDKDTRILELGSGMGEFLFFCIKIGYSNYLGVDMSDENIHFIKDSISSSAEIQKINMFDFFIDCEDDSFDVVVINDVIEHLTKEEIFDLLIDVKRILKKDGVFFIKTPNMANPFVNTAGRYIAFDHEIGFTEISMREITKACGYTSTIIIGTDIYVYTPIISLLARIVSKIIGCILWLFSALYGRTTLHIFEKDILAIVTK